MKNIRVFFFFLSEKFQFLEVKFSIYLNRRVFVMWSQVYESIVFFICLFSIIFLSKQTVYCH